MDPGKHTVSGCQRFVRAEKEVLLERRSCPLARSTSPQAKVNGPWASAKTSDNKEMSSTDRRWLNMRKTEEIRREKVELGRM